MSWQNSGKRVWDAERLRAAADAAGVALWSWNVDTRRDRAGRACPPVCGAFRQALRRPSKDLSAKIHPEDLDKVRSDLVRTRRAPGAYEIDFRILREGRVCWISARGKGDDEGIAERIMFGVFLDVTDRKVAEEAREMLAGEMSHRIKNLFAVASALTAIAARSAATTAGMARDLIQRLTALGLAHDLVRPDPGRSDGKVPLAELMRVLLAPYCEEGVDEERVRVSVPELVVGEAAATTLALVVHELATNSIKYGALSTSGGTLDVACTAYGGEIHPRLDGTRRSTGIAAERPPRLRQQADGQGDVEPARRAPFRSRGRPRASWPRSACPGHAWQPDLFAEGSPAAVIRVSASTIACIWYGFAMHTAAGMRLASRFTRCVAFSRHDQHR